MSERKLAIHKLALGLIIFLVMVFGMTGVAYAADAVEIKIPVHQTFTTTSPESKADETVEYALTPVQADAPMPQGSTGGQYVFSITGTNDAPPIAITYTHAGVYTYILKEIPVDPAQSIGYVYDSTEYTIYAEVKNGEKGLVIAVSMKASTAPPDEPKTSIAEFVVSYEPKATDPKLMVDPPVQKTITGTPASPATFSFTLTPENASNPMPDNKFGGTKTITIVGAGTKEFGVWSYTAAGTYRYMVTEDNTGVAGYTYDTTVYAFEDIVKDNHGQLELERKVTDGSGKTATTLTYNNIYTSDQTPPTPTPASDGKAGPKTGDTTDNTALIVTLAVAAVVAVGSILFFILRKRSKDEEGKNETLSSS